MLQDPPEVKQHAQRGDGPIGKWPGDVVTREDLMAASGDPRDWFRYGHRLKAYERAWAEFADARRRRRSMRAGFEWNQILVLGDYGSFKTTLAIHLARHYFGLGHAVSSNASCLFGWRLKSQAVYTAMGFLPKNSVLIIDESSAALASRVGHGVAVSSFVEMNLNTRKQNCIVIYCSAQDREIAAGIRRGCREVWKPVAKSDLGVEDRPTQGVLPANNPDNFRLAWHVWDDYPYRKQNLIEGKDPNDTGGFGPPTYTKCDEGENVRRALLLNDTFELAQAGSGTMADQDVVKSDLDNFLSGRGPSDGTAGAQNTVQHERIERMLRFFQHHEDDPPPFFRAADLARAMDCDSATAGRVLQEFIPVQQVRSKGYPSRGIYDYLHELNTGK